jgi:hypothetical protein
MKEAHTLLSSLQSGQSVRDVRFPEGLKWRVGSVDGVEFKNIDFGGPKIFGSWLGRRKFRRCLIDGGLLDGIAIWQADFETCTFRNASLGKRYKGLFKKCRFTDCSFQDCRIEDVAFSETSLSRCRIEGGRVTDSSWRECTLENVEAATEMKSTGFIGCSFRDVDFSKSKFTGCGFGKSAFGEPILPSNPDNFLLSPQELLELENELVKTLTPESLEKYQAISRVMSRVDRELLVDESMFSDVPKAERTIIMGTLYEKRVDQRARRD